MKGRQLLSTLLIGGGVALFAIAARHYVRGYEAQREGRRTFEKARGTGAVHRENPGISRAADRVGDDTTSSIGAIPARYPYGEPIARIRIPSAEIDAIVFGGADQDTLEKGPGHVPGTELPGEATGVNNCVITAHRDSHFRNLGWLKTGARIDLEARGGPRREYRVTSREIVTPEAVRVLRPTSEPRLTLITCYPFNYIGPAPKRLVVVAAPRP